MNKTELQFCEELNKLFIKYKIGIEEITDFTLPEKGFISNYKSMSFVGPNINIPIRTLCKTFK